MQKIWIPRCQDQIEIFFTIKRVVCRASNNNARTTMRTSYIVSLPFLIIGILYQLNFTFPLPPDAILFPLANKVLELFEQGRIPDYVSRFGTRVFLQRTLNEFETDDGPDGGEQQREYQRNFTADLRSREIAELTTTANEQHYEVDTRFYNLVLGKHHKYSSALYPSQNTDVSQALSLLDAAEDRMLHLYAQRARITSDDSFRVLDLGCGWGSVSLWFAAKFPKCTFVGFSNSKT